MWNANNVKGDEIASIDHCLNLLEMSYADLLLVHCPCTLRCDSVFFARAPRWIVYSLCPASNRGEYDAAHIPHYFELFGDAQKPDALPMCLPDGSDLRKLVLNSRRQTAAASNDVAKAKAIRQNTWKRMEQAKRDGKCRFIGVSNYPPELLHEMAEYADMMPAVNQIEFHPRYTPRYVPSLFIISFSLYFLVRRQYFVLACCVFNSFVFIMHVHTFGSETGTPQLNYKRLHGNMGWRSWATELVTLLGLKLAE